MPQEQPHWADQPQSQPQLSPATETELELRCRHYRQAFLLILQEPFADLSSTLQRMLEVLATTLDVERVSFWTFVDSGTAISCMHQFHRSVPVAITPTLLRQRDYPSYFAAVAKQLVVAVNDVEQDVRTSELDDDYLAPVGISSMLDVPVLAFGRYIGILCHEHVGPPRQWTVEEQHFASGVATQVALAHERDHAKRAQKALLQRSLHDEETHLPNWIYLENKLHELLSQGNVSVALALASVDQYHYVLGSLGAQRMQELVLQFARQLRDTAPQGALVARIAPNEFALLLIGLNAEQLPIAVRDWVAALKTPLSSGEQSLFLTLSTGYSCGNAEGSTTAEGLRAEAQLAMLAAAAEGGDRIKPFAQPMRERLLARAGKEQDLRRGLAAAEFVLYYQPIIHLATRRCVGVEALLRWQHPQRGVVMPDTFMEVAIESGVMLELGRHIIRMACADLTQLRRHTGIDDLSLAINLSAPEILLPGTAAAITRELARAHVPAHALTVEITESALLLDLERAHAALQELRATGVSIHLDDFGTAYSSLSWLRQLPIDGVKIDRGFVAGVGHDRRDLAIVKSIVGLAAGLEQVVVAEGIESAAQLTVLQDMGVEYGQGFFFARPQPVERFTAVTEEAMQHA